jgi:hypothetical protein
MTTPPKNTDQAIDARINNILATLPTSSSRKMLGRVYRPFCKTMRDIANENEPIEEALNAVVNLLANIVNETAMTCATPLKQEEMRETILDAVGKILTTYRKANLS